MVKQSFRMYGELQKLSKGDRKKNNHEKVWKVVRDASEEVRVITENLREMVYE